MNSQRQYQSQDSQQADPLAQLLALAKLGDSQAFKQLYQQSSARLNGIAYRITGNVDCANEVLQEAFIQIWQNKAQYQPEQAEAFTWMASIVRYRAYDKLRYQQRRHQDKTLEFDEIEHSTEQETNLIKLADYPKQKLDQCLEGLKAEQKQSILLAYLYGYSREELAVHFATPINTVKSWLKRGLGSLKLCLVQ